MVYQSHGLPVGWSDPRLMHGKRRQHQLLSHGCSTGSQTLACHRHHTCCDGKTALEQCLHAEQHQQF